MKLIRTKDDLIRLFRQSAVNRDKKALEAWHQERISLNDLASALVKNNRMGDIIIPLPVIEELARSLGYGKEDK